MSELSVSDSKAMTSGSMTTTLGCGPIPQVTVGSTLGGFQFALPPPMLPFLPGALNAPGLAGPGGGAGAPMNAEEADLAEAARVTALAQMRNALVGEIRAIDGEMRDIANARMRSTSFPGWDQLKDLEVLTSEQLQYILFRLTNKATFSPRVRMPRAMWMTVPQETKGQLIRQEKIRFIENRRCRYCKTIGHRMDNCPVLQSRVCEACGLTGHWISSCRNARALSKFVSQRPGAPPAGASGPASASASSLTSTSASPTESSVSVPTSTPMSHHAPNPEFGAHPHPYFHTHATHTTHPIQPNHSTPALVKRTSVVGTESTTKNTTPPSYAAVVGTKPITILTRDKTQETLGHHAETQAQTQASTPAPAAQA